MDDFTQQMLEALAKGDLDVGEVMRGLVRAEVEKGVNSVLKAELTGVLGYGKSEQGKAKEAGNSRDGYYRRKISTAYGDISVDVPRDRNGEFSTALLRPYQRRTDDIGQTVAKLYSAGMTDSEISEFVAFLYKGSYPASTVSAITDCLKEDVEAFRSSPIEPDWLAVFIDSTYVPLRRKTVEKEAINIAMGITMTGERRVIGWSITPQESAAEWASLLQSFKKRGMRSARIVVSDGLSGIGSAIDEALPGALHQRCVVHLARDLGAKVRPADRAAAMQGFMALARMASRKEALAGLRGVPQKMGSRVPVGEKMGRFARSRRGLRLLLVRREPPRQALHEQLHRGLQQADQKAAQEAHPVRGRGGDGEVPRVHIPALQRQARAKGPSEGGSTLMTD
jgi:putative transposase